MSLHADAIAQPLLWQLLPFLTHKSTCQALEQLRLFIWHCWYCQVVKGSYQEFIMGEMSLLGIEVENDLMPMHRCS